MPHPTLQDKTISYADLIDQSTVGFVGRQWLIDEVDRFLDHDGPRAFLLLGEPGCGKTAFLSKLVRERHFPHHFIGKGSLLEVEGSRDWRDPMRFAESIGYQLVREYGGWVMDWESWGIRVDIEINELDGLLTGAELETFHAQPRPADRPVLAVKAEIERFGAAAGAIGVYIQEYHMDVEQIVHQLLAVPLERIAKRYPWHQIVIVVDGLDEAEGYSNAKANILRMLPGAEVPATVRLILSSRPGKHLTNEFKEQCSIFWLSEDVAGQLPPNALDDAQAFVLQVAGETSVEALLDKMQITKESLSAQVAQASEGNFLYLHHYAEGLRGGDSDLLNLAALPRGLHGIYADFLTKIREGQFHSAWVDEYKPVMGALAVAHAPVNLRQLAGFSGVAPEAVSTILVNLKQFLDTTIEEEIGHYTLYHRSFGEYLTSKWNEDFVDGGAANRRIADSYLNQYRTEWDVCDRYGLQFLPRHILAAGRHEALLGLLSVPAFLEAKAREIGLEALLADFRAAINAPESIEHRSKLVTAQDISLLLHREAQKLVRWAPQDAPDYFAQQLVYASQKLDIGDFGTVAREWLAQKRKPWWSLSWHDDMSSHALQRTLLLDEPSRVCLIPGTAYLATQTQESSQIWDLNTWEPVHTFAESSERIIPSPDGRYLILLTEDAVELWQLASWRVALTIPFSAARYAQFTPDSARLLVAGDSEIQIWDINAQALVSTIPGNFPRNGEKVLTADGGHLLCRHEGGVDAVNLLTGDVTLIGGNKGCQTSAFAVSADGRHLALGFVDKALTVFDLETYRTLADLPHEDIVTCAAFIPEKNLLLTGGEDGALIAWNVQNGTREHTFVAHNRPVKQLVLSPTGSKMVSIDYAMPEWAFIQDEKGEMQPAKIVHTSDKDIPSGSIVWDLHTIQPLFLLSGQNSGAVSALFSGDAERLIIGYRNGILLSWDMTSSTSITSGHSERFAKNLLGKLWFRWRILRGLLQRRQTYHVRRLSPENKFVGHAGGVNWMDIFPDTDQLLSAGEDKTLKVWNMRSTRARYAAAGHENEIQDLALVPGSRRIVSASSDATLKVWDWETGTLVHTLVGHKREIFKLAVSPDGQTVISASKDADLRVWDLMTGDCVRIFRKHEAIVSDVVLSADGKCAISLSLDGTLYVWKISSGRVVHTIKFPHREAFDTADSLFPVPGGRLVIAIPKRATVKWAALGFGRNEKWPASPVVDIETGEIVNGLAFMDGIIFTPGARHLIAFTDDHLKVLDLNAESVEFAAFEGQPHVAPISAIVLSSDSQWVASAGEDSVIKIWNIETRTLTETLMGHSDEVRLLQISEDGRYLVSGGSDGTIMAWHTNTWSSQAVAGIDGPPTCLKLLPKHAHRGALPVAIVGDELGRISCLQLLEPESASEI